MSSALFSEAQHLWDAANRHKSECIVLQVFGSPIGAYLLLHLDAAHLQLSIAGVLTLVFLSMVFTPAQFKQCWQSIAAKLSFQHQAKRAQHEGYSELPPTPRLGAMQETAKGANTELTQPRHAEEAKASEQAKLAEQQQDKSGDFAHESQILKPSMLPATTMHLPYASSNSSSLGSLAPQAPPPINIHIPQSMPTPFSQPLMGSAHSTWSLQNSNASGTRCGTMNPASFNTEFLQHYLDADSSVNILARHNSRPAPPVVRVSHNSMDLVKQDVRSFHSSSPAMSWMRRLQPDPSTVVINYPVEYDHDRLQDSSQHDLESGRSPDMTPSSIPTPTSTRPPTPLPDLTSGTLLAGACFSY